jgi:hypothetical protein
MNDLAERLLEAERRLNSPADPSKPYEPLAPLLREAAEWIMQRERKRA